MYTQSLGQNSAPPSTTIPQGSPLNSLVIRNGNCLCRIYLVVGGSFVKSFRRTEKHKTIEPRLYQLSWRFGLGLLIFIYRQVTMILIQQVVQGRDCCRFRMTAFIHVGFRVLGLLSMGPLLGLDEYPRSEILIRNAPEWLNAI